MTVSTDFSAQRGCVSVPSVSLSPGRVVRIERSMSTVTTARGPVLVRSDSSFAVGDWVAVEERSGEAHLAEILPRWSELTRVSASGQRQLLAVNVDVVLIAA